MELRGTLAEVKSASKQLRKYGWINVNLNPDPNDPKRLVLTLTNDRISATGSPGKVIDS